MQTLLTILTFCITVMMTTGTAHAQENRWTVITTSQETLRTCSFSRIEDGSVHFVCGNTASHLSVDSIRQVGREKESRFWKGAGIGTLVGVVVGTGIGYASYEKPKSTTGWNLDFGPGFDAAGGAIVGAFAGFAVGGVIGAAAGADEVHDLASETHAERLRILNELAADHD